MSSPLDEVRPSEPIRASKQNELIRRVNAAGHVAAGGPLVAGTGAGGFRAGLRDLRRVAVWQLTGSMERPKTDGVTDDVPSAVAVPVWYFDVTGYPPENQYEDVESYTRAARVYHVAGFPGDQRDGIETLVNETPGHLAIPQYAAGDWVYAEYNNQSGRWEIMSPPEDIWRFELKTALVPNGDRNVPSTANAFLVIFDADEGEYVTTGVEFSVADFLDIWEGQPGDRGYAKRLADSHLEAGWEVVILSRETSSSSGDSSSSSGDSSSSSGESSSSSSSGETPPGLTTSVDVVVCDPYRQGDYVYFPQKRLTFVDGRLTGSAVLTDTAVYICCDESSSGGGSSGESSSATCTGLCGWIWNGSDWIRTSDTCSPGCSCDPPDFNGSSSGEQAATYCY